MPGPLNCWLVGSSGCPLNENKITERGSGNEYEKGWLLEALVRYVVISELVVSVSTVSAT